MKIVLDSNVIIAAFGARGFCNALFEYCLENHDIFICEDILSEISSKLTSKIKLSEAITAKITEYLRAYAIIVEPEDIPLNACRDRDGLMVLGTGLTGKVDFIITGDKDLLTIKNFHGIKILSPQSFWKEMKKVNEDS